MRCPPGHAADARIQDKDQDVSLLDPPESDVCKAAVTQYIASSRQILNRARWSLATAKAKQVIVKNVLVGSPHRKQFPEMIQGWRKNWGQGDFPFHFVQLANDHPKQSAVATDHGWPLLRET